MLLTKVASAMSKSQISKGRSGVTPSHITRPSDVPGASSQTLESFIESDAEPAASEELQSAKLEAVFALAAERSTGDAKPEIPMTPPRAARRRAHSWGNSPSGQLPLHFPLMSTNLSVNYRPTHRVRGKQPPRLSADPYQLPFPPRRKSEQLLDGNEQTAEAEGSKADEPRVASSAD